MILLLFFLCSTFTNSIILKKKVEEKGQFCGKKNKCNKDFKCVTLTISVSSKFRFFNLLFPKSKNSKGILAFENRIKWHQFSLSAASSLVVYLFRAVFMIPYGLLYCLNKTQFVHRRIGIWGKRCREMIQQGCWADVRLSCYPVSCYPGCGGLLVVQHYNYRMFSSPKNLRH